MFVIKSHDFVKVSLNYHIHGDMYNTRLLNSMIWHLKKKVLRQLGFLERTKGFFYYRFNRQHLYKNRVKQNCDQVHNHLPMPICWR